MNFTMTSQASEEAKNTDTVQWVIFEGENCEVDCHQNTSHIKFRGLLINYMLILWKGETEKPRIWNNRIRNFSYNNTALQEIIVQCVTG